MSLLLLTPILSLTNVKPIEWFVFLHKLASFKVKVADFFLLNKVPRSIASLLPLVQPMATRSASSLNCLEKHYFFAKLTSFYRLHNEYDPSCKFRIFLEGGKSELECKCQGKSCFVSFCFFFLRWLSAFRTRGVRMLLVYTCWVME